MAHQMLHTLIVLAWRTGRRLGAIPALRWDDVDFAKATIRWRAEYEDHVDGERQVMRLHTSQT